jgi:cytochrome bd-type quinol oxidase subunit 2
MKQKNLVNNKQNNKQNNNELTNNEKFVYNLEKLKEKYKEMRKKTKIYYINLIIFIIFSSILLSTLEIPIIGKFERSSNVFVFIIITVILAIVCGFYFKHENGYLGLYISLLIFFLTSILTFIFTIYPQTFLYKGNIINIYIFYLKIQYHFRVLFFNFITIFLIFISFYYAFQIAKK